MNRRALKYHVAAAIFLAGFCVFGENNADAYSYHYINQNLTLDQPIYMLNSSSENGITITDGSNITFNRGIKIGDTIKGMYKYPKDKKMMKDKHALAVLSGYFINSKDKLIYYSGHSVLQYDENGTGKGYEDTIFETITDGKLNDDAKLLYNDIRNNETDINDLKNYNAVWIKLPDSVIKTLNSDNGKYGQNNRELIYNWLCTNYPNLINIVRNRNSGLLPTPPEGTEVIDAIDKPSEKGSLSSATGAIFNIRVFWETNPYETEVKYDSDILDTYNENWSINVSKNSKLTLKDDIKENISENQQHFWRIDDLAISDNSICNGTNIYLNRGQNISVTNKSELNTNGEIQNNGEKSKLKIDGSSHVTVGTSLSANEIYVTNNSHLNVKNNITVDKLTTDGSIVIGSIKSSETTSSTINASTINVKEIEAKGNIKVGNIIIKDSGYTTKKPKRDENGKVVRKKVPTASGRYHWVIVYETVPYYVLNADSLSFSGNASLTGTLTTSNTAHLNGGAKLNNKLITDLGAGELSSTSNEAVNGAQLYTIKQKLATTGAGKTYTAGSDIAISPSNAISISKTGAVKAGNAGVVTGGTVYTVTNDLNTKLNSLKNLVNSHQTTITSLQQQMGNLNQTISDINSNVASATSNLSNQLKNCLKSDMGNLSAAGRTAIKNIVSDSLKSMGRQSGQTLTSPIATFAAADVKNTVNAKDVESVHTALADKVGKSALSDVSATVDTNTKQITSNADNIYANASSIESLKSGKSDVSGSNIDTRAYASKLGTGSVAKGNIGLVSGDAVYGALAGKADIGYVDSGIGMMENQMEGIRQQATHDMNRVGAGASALAGLHPTAYDASDKISFATGYGHYKNANTSALGAFYHPNEKTMVSVAGTIGNNDAMLSAGVSVKLGMSDHVSKVMVTPKMFSAQEVANQDMRDHLDTQSERIHQIELALQNR